ncbi:MULTISPECIES: hypothetical protein [Sphingopyxis]|uniref:hypothetical protein n=1 Tax=Sphingopyxis TaxID=165697 RepID=UPI0015CC90F4|nr:MULTISPECIES: hypothetical protein [Sphingopyxis]NYF30505.1 hypothetical protein [Sphingopyxis sp. JAI108]
MIAALLLLFLAEPETAPERSCEYCAAIFADVRLNAMIGNGNVEVSTEWAMGRNGDDVVIQVEDMSCPDGRKSKTCSFTLRRMLTRNGVAVTDPALPERLRCIAILKWVEARDGAGWGVKHDPPRRIGHSRTSMTCRRPRETS